MTYIPELDDPVSQLFLSCDLTNSTKFKQQQEELDDGDERSGPPWQHIFLDFYRDFPQSVAAVQRELGTEHIKFDLWKPIGDELIYSCKVLSEDDVYRAVRTWIDAMRAYEESSLRETGMGTKGGAFIATFPGPDSKSSAPRDPNSETSGMDPVERNRAAYQEKDHSRFLYDYFGPSIDTGFRVLTVSKSRYFSMSVEVALAMIGRSKVLGPNEKEFHVDDFVLLQFEELKGVWQGRPYPIVAIDLEYDDAVNGAYAEINPRGTADQLLALCRACIKDDKWPSSLYLPKSNDGHFKTEPVDPFASIATTSPEGVETEADDEPANATDLEANPPMGETVFKTGEKRAELAANLSPGEVEVALRAAIQKDDLDDDEYIARFALLRPMPSKQFGTKIFRARWGSLKGRSTDSTAPKNIPYPPHPFDDP